MDVTCYFQRMFHLKWAGFKGLPGKSIGLNKKTSIWMMHLNGYLIPKCQHKIQNV